VNSPAVLTCNDDDDPVKLKLVEFLAKLVAAVSTWKVAPGAKVEDTLTLVKSVKEEEEPAPVVTRRALLLSVTFVRSLNVA